VKPILGWDIGGANLKAVRVEGPPPRVAAVVERPFALWREPQRLPEMLRCVGAEAGAATTMAVTLTAELADCFASKREGVGFVLNALEAAFPRASLRVYGVDGRFRSVGAALADPLRVAAANWRATAEFVARTEPSCILMDVGSTTTDLIPILGGRVTAQGLTDPARLATGELVFTGALRTPVCAITRSLPHRGRRCRVAAEWFAIAADAHRWLGSLDEADYACETPDGRGRSRRESGARLARMIAADLELLDDADVTAIASAVASAQVRDIASGLQQVLRRFGGRAPRLALLAGQGAFLARAAAERVGLVARTIAFPAQAARAAPAAAVALLLAKRLRP
jgi:(4-(4-[2-(gamma-L-glutamylamino)ethyl]phenoxymethyl)furan-2-yl)methanamine synthase